MKLGYVAALRSSIKLDAAEDVKARIASDRAMLDHPFPCSFHTPLSLAASEGNVETVVRLLELGAAPQTAEDRPVTTPLHEAAQRGGALAVLALLEAGADPALRNLSGLTSLDLAAANGHVDAIRSLILEVAPQDRKRHDGVCAMALCHAAENGRAEMVDYLQRVGIPVNAFAAIALGNIDLISRPGSDVDPLAIRHPDYRFMLADGALPIHYAAAEGRHEALSGLLRLGADPNARTATGLNALAISAITGSFEGRSWETTRRIAEVTHRKTGRSGKLKFAKKSTDSPASKESAPSQHFPATRSATDMLIEDWRILDAASAVAFDEPELVDHFCKESLAVEELVPSLCLACWLGVERSVEMLLRHGVPANSELPGRPGVTALRLVAQGPVQRRGKHVQPLERAGKKLLLLSESSDITPKRGRIADLLLSHGAQDPSCAALTDAIKAKKNEVAITMLKNAAYPACDELDPHGQATATAILLSNVYVLGTLLKRGADPNRPILDLGGMLPLHAALAFHGEKSESCLRCLLEHGAKPELADATYAADAMGWAKYGFYPQSVSSEIKKCLSRLK